MIQYIINFLINYSKNKAKFIFTNFALLLCVFTVDAIPMSANSYKTKSIQGHAPYMHSIAARLDIDKNPAFTENGEAILTIGSIVYIPSEICNIPTITLESGVIPIDQLFFYYFHDQDRDDCIGLEHEIEWYMLQSNDKPWEEVNSWSELSATLISNQDYPGSILEPSLIYPGLRTAGLKIPQEAVGSRIGFIYKAYSKQGVPFLGPTIKVWDLNYFFSQNATSKDKSNQSLNEGSRTNLILDNTKAGGVVQPTTLPPSIESLKITGEFALGKQLKAEYVFISNGSADAEDRSLFWWGPEGTTAYLAAQAPTSGGLNAQSGILTESDLGQVLEVTVLPSKLELGQIVRGQAVTVTTRENSNEIQFAPSLLELTIESRFPEADGLVVNDMIYGQYRMQFGTNEQDASRYEWRRGLTNEIIQQGSTLPAVINAGSQGLTAPLILIPDFIGDFITLTVFPIDRNNLQGKSLIVSSGDINPLPFIDNLTLMYEQTGTSEPPEFGLEVNHNIYGTYEFTSFTQSVDRSIYNWEIDGSNELIQSGTANNGIVPSIRIQPEYLGQTIRLIVTAVDSVNRIGNVRNVVSGIVNQIEPEATSVRIIYLDDQYMLSVDHSIKGQYKFIPAVEGTSDNSSYIWQIKSNGGILEQGKTLIENELGVTPEFKIPFSAVGEIITLTILPFDNAGREGKPQTVDSLIVDYSYPVIT